MHIKINFEIKEPDFFGWYTVQLVEFLPKMHDVVQTYTYISLHRALYAHVQYMLMNILEHIYWLVCGSQLPELRM